MERAPVDSSAIATIGYDTQTSILEVEFRSGRIYRYYGVPRSVHRNLLSATSRGRFLNRYIKRTYPCTEVD